MVKSRKSGPPIVLKMRTSIVCGSAVRARGPAGTLLVATVLPVIPILKVKVELEARVPVDAPGFNGGGLFALVEVPPVASEVVSAPAEAILAEALASLRLAESPFGSPRQLRVGKRARRKA
jgi:hypothetical protein